MTAVFSHGRLRLYLLKLLAEGSKHGYELIRLLENRFLGLYAPSAGTIYPRLARLENEGLVTHTARGGRKVYEITDAGRAELAARQSELAELEAEIQTSIADLSTLATNIEREVSGSVRDIKRELREATRQARMPPWSAAHSWERDWRQWADGVRGRPGPQPEEPTGRSRGHGRGAGRRDVPPENGQSSDQSSAPVDGLATVPPGSTVPPASTATAGSAVTAGSAGAAVDDELDDLARALTDLAGEVRRGARQAGVGASEIRSATAVVVGAVNELRRLLKR